MLKITKAILNIFDGEGGGDGAMGDTNNAASTQAEQGDIKKVKYGKQPTDPATDTQVETKEDDSSKTQPTKKTFKELVSGEYKDDYTKATQDIINKRFKETKEMQAKLDSYSPLIDALGLKYGIADGNVDEILKAIDSDTEFLSAQAEEHGMTVEQYKQFSKLERENKLLQEAQKKAVGQQQAEEQIKAWMAEGEKVKETFPSFDMDSEVKNPEFLDMLKRGIPVEHAYKLIHYDEILDSNAKATQKAVTENIRAKGNRPAENGTNVGSAFTIKSDVSKLNRKDRAEIARRASRGELIEF